MKKNVLLLLIFSLILFACQEEQTKVDDIEATSEEISFIVKDTFLYNLSTGIPVEGGTEISKQAEHFQISKIQIDENGVSYLYIPDQNFKGIDKVELTRKFSAGGQMYYTHKILLELVVE